MHLKPALIAVALIALPPWAHAATLDEQALLDTEARLGKALVAGDIAALSSIYAADYHGRGAYQTKVDGKADFLAGFESRKLVFRSMTNRDLHAYVTGDTGYVLGTDDEKGTYAGEDISGTYVFLDVYRKRERHWVLVASQEGPASK